jgi:hypothetical protein
MELLESLRDLATALYNVAAALLALVAPWTPLIAWVAFWALGVNWVRLRRILLDGGWIGLLLLMFAAILTWGAIAPPAAGHHFLFGLTLSNFVGKTVYVTALVVIALLCGSVQLSGLCGPLATFDDERKQPDALPHAH